MVAVAAIGAPISAVVDRLPGGLDAGAEHRVRRAADARRPAAAAASSDRLRPPRWWRRAASRRRRPCRRRWPQRDSAWAAGMVRFRTRSTSSAAQQLIDGQRPDALVRAATAWARAGSRSATAATSADAVELRGGWRRYWRDDRARSRRSRRSAARPQHAPFDDGADVAGPGGLRGCGRGWRRRSGPRPTAGSRSPAR